MTKNLKIRDQWIEYSNLCDLLKSYEFYGMVYEDFYEVNNVVEYFSRFECVSKRTIESAQKFQEAWYKLIKSKSYCADRVFMYIDSDFQLVLDNELKSFLTDLNKDLDAIGFENIESLIVMNRKLPDNEVILERASTLYDLLLKHKITRK